MIYFFKSKNPLKSALRSIKTDGQSHLRSISTPLTLFNTPFLRKSKLFCIFGNIIVVNIKGPCPPEG